METSPPPPPPPPLLLPLPPPHLPSPPPLAPPLQPANMTLRWQVAATGLRGSEGSINIPILFGLNEVPQNMENDSSSNNVTVNIPVGARAAVTVQM